MKIGIIDADFIIGKKHRFPNLACMKLSAYHKQNSDDVSFITDFNIDMDDFDRVYCSKVFTDTVIPDQIMKNDRIVKGGTGFYFDKAPALSYEIEHSMPDYHLYDSEIMRRISMGEKRSQYSEYLDYSIGFLTRRCFRKCGFCVNQNYNQVIEASPLSEFLDADRPKIALLDDNFLGSSNWKNHLIELQNTGKPFKFKQGLDERILTPEKVEMLFSSKYDGEITFAFDQLKDYQLIEKKLQMIRGFSDKEIKFYVLCGWNEHHEIDGDFWKRDIESIFLRMELLSRYGALPYIMRHKDYLLSPYDGVYKTIARWVNQPGFYRNYSFNEFVDKTLSYGEKAPARYREIFLAKYPSMNDYFNNHYKKGSEND